ncbi:MAG: hypothetical protein AAF361_11510 [Bacteroidota bacterium]
MKLDGSVSDPLLATGRSDLTINLLNIKVGAKLGGLFYFRPELGFGLPFGDSSYETVFRDPITNTTTTQSKDIPLKGGFIINIGIGFAF